MEAATQSLAYWSKARSNTFWRGSQDQLWTANKEYRHRTGRRRCLSKSRKLARAYLLDAPCGRWSTPIAPWSDTQRARLLCRPYRGATEIVLAGLDSLGRAAAWCLPANISPISAEYLLAKQFNQSSIEI